MLLFFLVSGSTSLTLKLELWIKHKQFFLQDANSQSNHTSLPMLQSKSGFHFVTENHIEYYSITRSPEESK
jgi:hypothetical protein